MSLEVWEEGESFISCRVLPNCHHCHHPHLCTQALDVDTSYYIGFHFLSRLRDMEIHCFFLNFLPLPGAHCRKLNIDPYTKLASKQTRV